MLMKKEIVVILFIIILFISLYVAYIFHQFGEIEISKELKIAISTDISSLDINYATSVSDFEVLGKVYESLFRIDFDPKSKKLVYVPWLVEDYKCINSTFYIFILKNGIKFHNGEKLTAWDVKASIERAVEISPIGKMLLRDIHGDSIIKEIIVYNISSFALKLRKPFAPLLEHLAHLSVAIMPRNIAETHRNSIINNTYEIIGTGPYRLIEYVRGQYVKLRYFDEYWYKKPKIEHIVYMIIPESIARIAAIEAGQVDIAVGIPPEAVNRLESKGLKIYVEIGARLVIVAINVQRISDPRIRQAMNYAIDKNIIIDTIMNRYATVASSIASTIFQGAISLEAYSYNIDKAKQLINEAGSIDRTLRLLVSTRSPKDIELAQIIKSSLSSIDIDIEVQILEHTAFLKKVFREHDFDLAIYGPSPSSLYYALTYWRTGASLNAPLYSNPDVDRFLDEVVEENNIDRQYEIYKRIQEIIWSERPAIWLYYENIIVATRSSVEGLRILPFQMFILDDIFIKG